MYNKYLYLLLCAIIFSGKAYSQTAAFSNSGSGAHQDEILWLTWDDVETATYNTSGLINGGTTGFIKNDVPRIYNLPNGAQLTVTFKNINYTPWLGGTCGNDAANKNCGYQPTDINSIWDGSCLKYGYNAPGKEVLFSNVGPGPSNEPGQDAQEIKFTMEFAMTVNGISVPVDVIFSDAETTNPNNTNFNSGPFVEEIHAKTNGTNWQLIENISNAYGPYLPQNSNNTDYVAPGIGTDSVRITDTETAFNVTSQGDNEVPVLLTNGIGNTTVVDYQFLYKGQTGGHQGFMVGVLYPKDHGDAPASYGDAAHYQDMGPSGTAQNPTLANNEPVYLGNSVQTTTDCENVHNASGGADGDDNDGVDDEDGITLPNAIISGTNNITIQRTGTGYLNGWIDFNEDGDFLDPGEQIFTDATGTPTSFQAPFEVRNGTTYARFRICANPNDCNTPFGLSGTGEVEDYVANLNLNLPIELLKFDARANEQNQVVIDWTTISEVNNNRFEVERSINTADWETIATVKGAGNSNQKKTYTAIDNNPNIGKNYYRLKQVDNDGKHSYSETKLVSIGDNNPVAEITIFPNPSNGQLGIQFVETMTEGYRFILRNKLGQVLESNTTNEVVEPNSRDYFDLSKYQNGVYYITIQDFNGFSKTQKLVLIK